MLNPNPVLGRRGLGPLNRPPLDTASGRSDRGSRRFGAPSRSLMGGCEQGCAYRNKTLITLVTRLLAYFEVLMNLQVLADMQDGLAGFYRCFCIDYMSILVLDIANIGLVGFIGSEIDL